MTIDVEAREPPMICEYARTSTDDQTSALQIDALDRYGSL